MYDSVIVGPTVFCLALIDIILHIAFDIRKIKSRPQEVHPSSQFVIPTLAFVALGLSTVLSFILVLLLILIWFGLLSQAVIQLLIPLIDAPLLMWTAGLITLCSGIILHGWSRLIRQNMASSWQMGSEHRLVISGPYARIRHPSYLSYFLCFLGLLLLLPSLATLLLLIGIPGYHIVARVEEEQLQYHFGKEYSEYMGRTGMFLPRFRLSKTGNLS